jgi:hypothetical protein
MIKYILDCWFGLVFILGFITATGVPIFDNLRIMLRSTMRSSLSLLKKVSPDLTKDDQSKEEEVA